MELLPGVMFLLMPLCGAQLVVNMKNKGNEILRESIQVSFLGVSILKRCSLSQIVTKLKKNSSSNFMHNHVNYILMLHKFCNWYRLTLGGGGVKGLRAEGRITEGSNHPTEKISPLPPKKKHWIHILLSS